MRLVLLVAMATTLPATVTLAQGTKDSANFGTVNSSKSQQSSEASRPTTVRNTPTNALPAGTAIQRVYRDGKLQAIVR